MEKHVLVRSRLFACGFLAFLITLDVMSKAWVQTHLPFHQLYPVTSFLALSYWQNTGVAFSFFAHEAACVQWLLIVFSVGIAGYLWYTRARVSSLSYLGYLFLIAGALGNTWDRIALGRVTDFILLHIGEYSWPVFNLADTWVSVGVVCCLIGLREKRS